MASSARIDELQKKFTDNPRRYFAPLANEYRKTGQVDQAIALCREHLPKQPGHMSGHIVYGQALYEVGELDTARGVFQTALDLDPENLIALRHMGDIERRAGQSDDARRWYTRVLDADPRNAEVTALLAEFDQPAVLASASTFDSVESAFDAATATAEPATEQMPIGFTDDRLMLDRRDDEEGDSDTIVPGVSPSAEASAINVELEDVSRVGLDEPEFIETPLGSEPNDFLGQPVHFEGGSRLSDPPAFATERDLDGAAPDDERYAPPADESLLTTTAAAELEWTVPPDAHPSAPSVPDEWESDVRAGETGPLTDVAEGAPVSGAIADDAASDPATLAPIEAYGYDQPPAVPPATALAPVDDGELPSIDSFAYDEPLIDAFAFDGEPALVEARAPRPAAAAVERSDDVAVTEPVAVAPSPELEVADPVGTREGSATPSSPFVTATMAELYVRQGFHDEALGVYEQLLARDPANATLRARFDELRGAQSALIGGNAEAATSLDAEPSPSLRADDGAYDAPIAAAEGQTGLIEAPTPDALPPHGDELEAVQAPTATTAAPEAPPRTARAFFAALAGRAPGRTTRRTGAVEALAAPAAPTAASPAAAPPPMGVGEAGDDTVVSLDGPGFAADELDSFVDAPPAETTNDVAARGAERDRGAGEAAGVALVDVADGEGAEALPSIEAYAYDAGAARNTPRGLGAVDPDSGSLDALFGFAPIGSIDAAAAATLADAFAGDATEVDEEAPAATPPAAAEPVAPRPTRPAPDELSLDAIFRAAPRPSELPPRATPTAFSFDQFFADDPAPFGAPPADVAPANPSDESESDLEQFNSWLESLKRK